MIAPFWIKYAIAGGLAVLFGWFCYDYGHDSVMSEWQKERAEINAATSSALIKMQSERDAMETKLTASESKAWEQYKNAETKANELNSELVNRPWRVRVDTSANACRVPESSATSGMGDDRTEQFAELPIATTRSVIAIGQDADRCEAKLKALQDWAKIVIDK